MPHVDLTTNLDNSASQKIIRANGGLFIEEFERDAEYGGGLFNLYRISLS
jgi:predicted acetyltransferase